MAYAKLAGLPPEYGLYAGIVAPLAYLFFGTIKQLSIGPSSSEAILLASVLGGLVISDPARYAALAALTAIMVGIIAIIARIFRLGFIANLISGTVMKGFLAGVGLVIIVGQIPKLLRIEGVQGSFFDKLANIIVNLPATHFLTLLIAIAGIALLFLIEKKFPRWPATLVVVVIFIVIMSITNLAARGVHIVGPIPQGLPQIKIPDIQVADIQTVLPLAAAMFLLSYVETAAIGKNVSKEKKYPVDPDQELVALGASSLATGMTQGFPIAGSFSRTALNIRNKAMTPMAGGIAALITAVVALYFTGLFTNLPEAIIGVLIVVAVNKMIDIKGLRRIGVISKLELAIALLSLFGVLIVGVLFGIMVGIILSLLHLGYKLTYPYIAELGRLPGTDNFGDIKRNKDAERTPSALILRVDSPVIFANAETVKKAILTRVLEARSLRVVILDMGSSPIIDITAADMIGDLKKELEDRSIDLRIVHAKGSVREMLRNAGYDVTSEKSGASTILEEYKE